MSGTCGPAKEGGTFRLPTFRHHFGAGMVSTPVKPANLKATNELPW